MKLTKNRKGQTDSVFKLALVVIIIAAVLAVVAYMMGQTWSGTETLAQGTEDSVQDVDVDVECLTGGANCDRGGL
jgi:uncharacterized protein (UPF0333 family)